MIFKNIYIYKDWKIKFIHIFGKFPMEYWNGLVATWAMICRRLTEKNKRFYIGWVRGSSKHTTKVSDNN